MSAATSCRWLVSSVGVFVAVPCLSILAGIRDAWHYRQEVEPLLAGSSQVASILERWAHQGDLDLQSVLRTSRVHRAKLYGFQLSILMSKYDSYGPDALFQDQLSYKFHLHRVRDGGLVLDVGGNVGVTAVLLAKVNPGARVVSLEPLPQNRLYLELNLAVNGLDAGRVDVRAEALASRPGTVQMSYNPEVPAASGLYWASSGVFDRSREQVFSVRQTTLAALLEDLGAERVDLLKLDCEGCEYDVVPALGSAALDGIGYAVGDVHHHFAHLFDPEASRAVHAALCGRGWGITHLLCSPSELEPLLQLVRQAQQPA